MTVKTLQLRPRVRLVPQNRRYSPIELKEGSELQVFGVVVSVVRVLK
jgi:DNA polymerase V